MKGGAIQFQQNGERYNITIFSTAEPYFSFTKNIFNYKLINLM